MQRGQTKCEIKVFVRTFRIRTVRHNDQKGDEYTHSGKILTSMILEMSKKLVFSLLMNHMKQEGF